MDLDVDIGGDERGKIIFSTYGNTKCNLFEIKKGYARGGHYHPYPVIHNMILGKIEYREFDMTTNIETKKIISAPSIFNLKKNTSDLIIAIDNSLFTEIYVGKYVSKTYFRYRDIVDKLRKQNL